MRTPRAESRQLDASTDLTGIDRADVYKSDRLAGHLVRTDHGIRFGYTTEWASGQGEPVATTLPVAETPVMTPANTVPSFFAGLLPEGRRLGALRRTVKTSADDEFSLLLAVGGDTIGDVRVVPAGAGVTDVSPLLRVTDFTGIRFRDLLADLNIRPDRVGIPGVQDKASTAIISVPVAHQADRYILKLNPPEYPRLVENEAFFLKAARDCRLRVAEAELVRDVDGTAGLLVRRFDRTVVDDGIVQLACEDGCQVLNRPPGDKYLVDTEQLVRALSDVCGAPRIAARIFLTQLVFAFLTGNGDAHAKNFSVLRGVTGEWQASPAYDLPSSYLYGDSTMALPIAGRRDADICGSDFIALGEKVGVPARASRKLLADLSARADLWLPGLVELPFDLRLLRKLRRTVAYRRASLQR